VANRSGVDDCDSPVIATERRVDVFNKPGLMHVVVADTPRLTGTRRRVCDAAMPSDGAERRLETHGER
jgi:hypothetical protein